MSKDDIDLGDHVTVAGVVTKIENGLIGLRTKKAELYG